MKLFLAGSLLLLIAFPASAQSAKVFVKVNGAQCWLDVRQVVHERSRDVTEDDQLQILRTGHFSTPSGDMFMSIQVLTEKNDKGEEGCRIYVGADGGGVYAVPSEVVSDTSVNTRIANEIAARVVAMEKAREKKEKKSASSQPNP